MRRSSAPSPHRLAILAYIAFALFPLFWLVKVSVTPNDLLYTEGVRLWPSRDHLRALSPSCSRTATSRASSEQPDRLGSHRRRSSPCSPSLAGYALSRFAFRGKLWIVGADAAHPDVPAGHAGRADLQDALAARPHQQPDRPHHRLHRLQRALRHLPDAVLLRRHPAGPRGGGDDRRRHAASPPSARSSCR